jgi:23S rRNA (adenine2030-N6)-methyltransferase
MRRKDKPFWVIDTHAGAGLYALDSGYATRLAEYEDGIGRLWSRTDLPPALADYVAQVRALNPDGTLRRYPGSPWLALQALRAQDQLRLFERHSSDSQILLENLGGRAAGVHIRADDGFAGLKATLPPAPRRGLILIDPSYETRDDYGKVVAAVKDALVRFATGTYAIWYPQLARTEARLLPERLRHLKPKSWLDASLTLRAPGADGIGMHGSGLFVINPPWTLVESLQAILPYLVQVLGQERGARFDLAHEVP